MTATAKPQLNPALKLALDLGPLVLFFFANSRYGIFAATAEGMKPYIQKGYTLPIAGMDLMLLSVAARGMVQALK